MSYKYLNAVGTNSVISEIKTRLATKVTQVTTMDTASVDNLGSIVLFTGTSNDYSTGAFYQSVYDEAASEYKWAQLSYNKAEVDNIVSSAGHFVVVKELPTTNIQTNVIYLIPKVSTLDAYTNGTAQADAYVATDAGFDKYVYSSTLEIYQFDSEVTGTDADAIQADIDGGTLTATTITAESRQTRNIKDEYINLDGTTTGWEKIGDTEIDLSDYVRNEDLVAITDTELAAMWAGTYSA